jgi:hypothetical protein
VFLFANPHMFAANRLSSIPAADAMVVVMVATDSIIHAMADVSEAATDAMVQW